MALAQFDVLHSLASVATHESYVKPELSETPCLHIEQGRHPTVAPLISHPFIPNDTEMKEKRTFILTGPNMGGKTSYARQAALLCIMAQIGSYVPAESMTLSPMDGIYTRMGAQDCMQKGLSTFQLELQEV